MNRSTSSRLVGVDAHEPIVLVAEHVLGNADVQILGPVAVLLLSNFVHQLLVPVLGHVPAVLPGLFG